MVDHDRDLLHRPADWPSTCLHRRVQRHLRAVPDLGPATFNNPFYYIALALAVATIAVSWLIRRSRFGLQLRAIRDDEDRAAGLGVRAMPVKLAAFVISAHRDRDGGRALVLLHRPGDTAVRLRPAVRPLGRGDGVLRRARHVAGPLLGALIIEPTQQYLTLQYTNEYLSEILLGVLFLAVILGLPRGVIPTAAERIDVPCEPGAARAPGPGRGSAGQAAGRRRGRPRRDRPAQGRGRGQGFRRRPGAAGLHGRGRAGHDRRPDRARTDRARRPCSTS